MEASPAAGEHERISLAGATMAWDATARLFIASYVPNARPGAPEATEMQRWMDARAGPERPFDIIVDLRHADKAAIAWRYRWVSWFYANRKRMRVAIYNAARIGPTIVSAFALSTRTDIRTFENEAEARAWLGQGPPSSPGPESI